MKNNNSLPDKNGEDIRSHNREESRYKTIEAFIGRFRLRTVLTVSLVIIVILAIGVTAILAFLNSQYAVSELAGNLQNEITDRIEQHLDSYLEIPHLVNHLCMDSISLGEINIHDNTGLTRHFQELSYRFDSVESICYANELDGNYTIISSVGAPGIVNGTDRFLGFSLKETGFNLEEYRIDREGTIIEKTLTIKDYDPRTRPWYQSAVQAEGPVWTPVYMWIEGVVSLDAVVPVYTQGGELLGVLDTSLTLAGIGEFLQSLQISTHGQAFIMDSSGLLVASSSVKEPYTRKDGKLVRLSVFDCNDSIIRSTAEYMMDHISVGEKIDESRQFYFDINGSRQFVQVTPYQDKYGLDWIIVVVIPESDFMDKINANNQTTIFLIIVAVIGAILISILLGGWITNPILSMNQAAKALARGDWKSWKDLNRRDELGELSNSFKKMAIQLQASFSSLKSSEERYMSLFQSSTDAILLFEGLILTNINRAGEEMFRVTGREITGKDVRDLFGPAGDAIYDMIESSGSIEGRSYTDKTISRMIGEREEFMNIRLAKIPIPGLDLNLVHIRDITDQRQAIFLIAEREALHESYSQIEMILELLPDPTFVIDNESNVLFWNQAMERITGLKSEDITGRKEYSSAEGNRVSKRVILIDLALHPEIITDDLYPYIEYEGDVLKTSFWIDTIEGMKFLSVIAAPLYDRNGILTGAIESIRDITSHKMAEEALLVANKKLNLLSSITRHDILNKITISKAYIFLLDETDLNYEQKDSIVAIKHSLAEIEGFIAFTRIYEEIGLKVPTWQDVGEAFSRAEHSVQSGDVIINNEIKGISILADPLFEKVCYNLIENAIRHGGDLSRIDITVEETDEGLRISVQDDGPGVEDEIKEIIFERGYGTNTGYGLFLAREILSLSEITITERGMFGEGCRLDIDVPKGKFRYES